MCLSAAYETKNGVDKLICDKITNVQVEPNEVILTDLLGVDRVVAGVLKSIDLNRNVIKIEVK